MAKYVNVPEQARGISYADEDYAETLARIFNHSLSKEDILNSIGTPWVAISSGTLTSTGTTFEFKNLSTTYISYMINITGLLIDTTAGTGSLGIRTSTDNGATYNTGATDYTSIKWGQDAASAFDEDYGNADRIYLFPDTQTRDNVRDGESVGEHSTIMLDVSTPADPNLLTSIRYKALVSDTSGNIAYSTGIGYRKAKEANNAIQLITSANTFDAGFYDVYGLKRAVS